MLAKEVNVQNNENPKKIYENIFLNFGYLLLKFNLSGKITNSMPITMNIIPNAEKSHDLKPASEMSNICLILHFI